MVLHNLINLYPKIKVVENFKLNLKFDVVSEQNMKKYRGLHLKKFKFSGNNVKLEIKMLDVYLFLAP